MDELLNEIENLKEELENLCEDCGGTGEIINTAKIHSRTIDVPYAKCFSCRGTGTRS